MDSRFKRNQKIKLLEKFRGIITLGRKKAFLIRTENSDSINKKTNIFDNKQYFSIAKIISINKIRR